MKEKVVHLCNYKVNSLFTVSLSMDHQLAAHRKLRKIV